MVIVVLAVPSNSIMVFADSTNKSDAPNKTNGGGTETGLAVSQKGSYKVSVSYSGKGLYDGNEKGALGTDKNGNKGIKKGIPGIINLFKATCLDEVPLYTKKTPVGLVYGSKKGSLPESIRMFSKDYNVDLMENLNKFNSNNELKNIGCFGIGSIYFTGSSKDPDNKSAERNPDINKYEDWDEKTNAEIGITVESGKLKYKRVEDAMKGRKINKVSIVKEAAEKAYDDWIDNYGEDANAKGKKSDYLRTFFKNYSLYRAIYDGFTVTDHELMNGKSTKFNPDNLFKTITEEGLSEEKKTYYSARNTLVAMTILNLMKGSYKKDTGVRNTLNKWYKDYASRTASYELSFIIEPFAYLRNNGSGTKGSYGIITPNNYLAGWKKSGLSLSDFPTENASLNVYLNKNGKFTGNNRMVPKGDRNTWKDTYLWKATDGNIGYTWNSGYNADIIGCVTKRGKITDEYEKRYYDTDYKDIQTNKTIEYFAVGTLSRMFSDNSSYSSPIHIGSKTHALSLASKMVYTGYTYNYRYNKQILIKKSNDDTENYSYARLGWGLLHTSDFISLANPGTSAEMYTSTISLISRDTKTIGSEYLGNTEDTRYKDKAKATIDKVADALETILPVMKAVYNSADGDSKKVLELLIAIMTEGKLNEEDWSDLGPSYIEDINDFEDEEKLKEVSALIAVAELKMDIAYAAEQAGITVTDEMRRIKGNADVREKMRRM